MMQFGRNVEGFSIPVLNEREIRAAAGILFVMMFVAIQQAGLGNFTPIKFAITFFLTDISIRVFLSPEYSPALIVGRLIVRNQTPEYVGAIQKKFAWWIGFGLSASVFILMVVMNTFSPISGIACMICLIFLFFETSFGICLGCKFYALVYKEKAQYCPGEICDIKSRHEIQKTSKLQIFIILGFIIYIAMMIYFLNETYSKVPYDLFGIEEKFK
jgi:hypothetical protein